MATRDHELTLDEIRQAWSEAHVSPLWENARAHANTEHEDAPQLWAWRTMQPMVAHAIALTSPAVAERRVLSLVDPNAQPGDFHSIPNLNGALQILFPGRSRGRTATSWMHCGSFCKAAAP